MKAIVCAEHGDLHIFTFGTEWTTCVCGNVKVKWVDPDAGTVVVAARSKERVRLLCLNNRYLAAALLNKPDFTALRGLHDAATQAPGFIFDKEKANCWAVVTEVGRTSDVRWATVDEFKEAFGF